QIFDPKGCIRLVAGSGVVAASWSFLKLMTHWNKKHAYAAYVPCMKRDDGDCPEYSYGSKINLGEGTDFAKFLECFASGLAYYDPGMNAKDIGADARGKPRSQFRIRVTLHPFATDTTGN